MFSSLVLNLQCFNLLMVLLSFGNLSQAHILEGLRDAVLGAEGTLSEIFNSLESVAKHIKFSKEAWQDSVEEECKFVCPNGGSPKKNKYHTPSSNGCGVPGMEIDVQFLPLSDMTKCCDRHDICYGTCNNDKDECDLTFKKCLYKLCDNSRKTMTETVSTGCKTAAKMLYSGTMMFGCKFYKTAQEEACYCVPRKTFSGDEL